MQRRCFIGRSLHSPCMMTFALGRASDLSGGVDWNRILSMLAEEERPAVSGKADRRALHLVFPRWMTILLAIALVVPWLVMGALLVSRKALSGKSQAGAAADAAGHADVPVDLTGASSAASVKPADAPPQEWTSGKKGPWGQVDSMLFAIDLPDEFVFVPPVDQPPIRWSFPDYGKDKVLATLRSVGLPEDEVNKKLDASGKWSSDGGVVAVEPGDRLILSLAPEVRAKLYAILVVFPQNARQIDPIWFRQGQVDWRLQDSGLAAESIALLKRLLYAQGENMLLFADFEPALRSLPDDAERRRFMKAISRKRAVLARLNLGPDTDVEKLAQYWGIGGRRKDIFPFLSALHRVEKGCTLNIVCLLPDFPRDHLYRHPFASAQDKSVKQDCFWSAFNFFNDPTDDRFNDMAYVREVLDRDYYEIQQPSQLGDIVFVTAEKTVIHVAAYVADDLVFTKNGEDFRQPWILMHIADMMETYVVKYPNSGALKLQFFRKKSL
jgi:hypothetical protein